MLTYRINRPYEAMCHGDQPIAAKWQEIGLGHLLPIKLTGGQYPVQRLSADSFCIGHVDPFQEWTPLTDTVSIALSGTKDFHPKLVERPNLVPGTVSNDKFGRSWIIPNANPQSPYLSIPNELSWGLDGPRMIPDEAYRPVMDLCVRTFSEVESMLAIDRLWAASRCLEILQINYRIGLFELTYLEKIGQQVIDREFSARVVLWFIDFELLEELIKKKQLAE